ncbi:hypothetical protein [Halorientalis regularis]|jgi:hypothetical protein|uniref:Small CPxCG-related zinc finger protein n=1 Tax=Halorientalis regularis TaxID=660518 RepID=A0A1G7R8A7_9EURY|nr:hypothetical protein [Halorientalis regularis]SDG06967.1 hypothetical protein SAMN05216218_11498 [Halorientalis regularis]
MAGDEDSPTADDRRIERLESEVAELRDRVDHQYEIIAVLAAAVNSEALPEMSCPDCTDGTLTTNSGLTWERVECTDCDFSEYL